MFRKKSVSEIDPVRISEPDMFAEDWKDYEEGWRLFNEKQFWHAHEAWENVWKRRPEESRIFFQGIVQLAAAYHLLLVKNRYGGMMKNFDKAEEKLKLFPSKFLRVDVAELLNAINVAREEVQNIGSGNLEKFSVGLIPVVTLDS